MFVLFLYLVFCYAMWMFSACSRILCYIILEGRDISFTNFNYWLYSEAFAVFLMPFIKFSSTILLFDSLKAFLYLEGFQNILMKGLRWLYNIASLIWYLFQNILSLVCLIFGLFCCELFFTKLCFLIAIFAAISMFTKFDLPFLGELYYWIRHHEYSAMEQLLQED